MGIRRRGTRDEGQAIALFALVLTVVLAALALVIDVGFAYADRRYQQDAADAAALRGASMVFDGRQSDAQIRAEIDRLMGLNRGWAGWTSRPPWYVDASQRLLAPVGGGVIPAGAEGVACSSQTVREGFFSWIVGMPEIPVSADAVAIAQRVQTCSPGDGLIPLTVPLGYLEEKCGTPFDPTNPPTCSVPIDLKSPKYHKVYAGYGGDSPPANWKGVVDFSPKQVPHPVKCPPQNKPKDVECWIEEGFEGDIEINDDLPTFNGDLGSNTSGLLRNPQKDAAGRTYGIIYVPIYDRYTKSSDTINVAAFSAFVVYEDEIQSSTIIGHLTQLRVPPGIWNNGGGGCTTFWASTVRLVPPAGSLPQCPGGVCPTFTPAATSTPGGATATATVAPPTATGTPVAPTATGTSVPPTRTSTPVPPTNTPVPPTATPVPPTATPVWCELKPNGTCHPDKPKDCVCPPGT